MRFECGSCHHLGEPVEVVAHGTNLSMRCERCGVATAIQPEARAQPTSTPLPDVPPPDDAWARVLDRWDDHGAHDAYLGAMTAAGALGDAAARYRTLASDPVRGPGAQERLARIAILAEHALAATLDRPDPVPFRRRLTLVAAIVCVALVGLMLWALAK